MPIYRYQAFNRRGKEEKGIIDAGSPAVARKILKHKGLYVKNLAEDQEKKDRETFPLLSKLLYRIPRRDVGLFVRQLGTLLQAGIPLDRSLSNIIEQTENEYLAKALIEIRSGIIEGATLSDSMKKHPAIFPPLYHNLISVGEKTGTYESSLLRLADLEEANESLKRKVTSALFYPIIMLVLLGAIMVFLLAVVFPQIKQLFVQMDAELPLITKIVLGISDTLTSIPWVMGIIAVISAVVYVFQRWKATDEGREIYERFKLKLPIVGPLNRKVVLARFSRNMGVMLENRVPLITALQVISQVVEHRTFELEIKEAIEKIKEGSKLTDGFRDSTIVSQMMMGMLSAGEASDTVPDMVNRIADVLDDDVDATIQKISTLLEPAMIVIMGGAIVIIMAAILLPMYGLTEQLQI